MTDVEPYDRNAALEEQIRRHERRASAIRLRNSGASVAKIALVLGFVDEDEAAREITAYLDELTRIPAGELVARQQAMIMDMTRACYHNAMAGDINSVKMIKEIMDHQAKLFGLYAPTRQRVALGDDLNFTDNVTKLLGDLGVSTVIDVPPTIDADEPWAM